MDTFLCLFIVKISVQTALKFMPLHQVQFSSKEHILMQINWE